MPVTANIDVLSGESDESEEEEAGRQGFFSEHFISVTLTAGASREAQSQREGEGETQKKW